MNKSVWSLPPKQKFSRLLGVLMIPSSLPSELSMSDATGSVAVDTSLDVDFHSVRLAGAFPETTHKTSPPERLPSALTLKRLMCSLPVSLMRGGFARQEAQAVRLHEIVGHQGQRPVRVEAEHALEIELALARHTHCGVLPTVSRVGKPDPVLAIDDDVVRAVQLLALVVCRENADVTPIGFDSRDAARRVLLLDIRPWRSTKLPLVMLLGFFRIDNFSSSLHL